MLRKIEKNMISILGLDDSGYNDLRFYQNGSFLAVGFVMFHCILSLLNFDVHYEH